MVGSMFIFAIGKFDAEMMLILSKIRCLNLRKTSGNTIGNFNNRHTETMIDLPNLL